MLHLYPLKAEILFISYMAAHPERLHNDSSLCAHRPFVKYMKSSGSPTQTNVHHSHHNLREVRKKSCLADLPSPLSDLRRETSLDGLDGTSRSAAVAGDEVEAVLTLGETAWMLARCFLLGFPILTLYLGSGTSCK
jgi:hypothetical protein